MVNCAHPDHVARGLPGDGPWDRVHGLRVNASDLSHEELDAVLPAVTVVGGCCGTDARHVEAIWRERPTLLR